MIGDEYISGIFGVLSLTRFGLSPPSSFGQVEPPGCVLDLVFRTNNSLNYPPYNKLLSILLDVPLKQRPEAAANAARKLYSEKIFIRLQP